MNIPSAELFKKHPRQPVEKVFIRQGVQKFQVTAQKKFKVVA
jgi:hypothetical protein